MNDHQPSPYRRLVRKLQVRLGTGEVQRPLTATQPGRYRRLVKNLLARSRSEDEAMSLAVGGEFEAIGLIERDLLIFIGLPRDGFVVDVGCGSGRLAVPLSGYLKGGYLGTDVVPELLAYARRVVARPDWRFELVDGLVIPAADGTADVVCFFSVFTHLLHEESYRYLEEAKRVLKPSGRIVFSFLEFAVASLWYVFEANLATLGSDLPLNQFMSRDAIHAWAEHLGLTVVAIYDDDSPAIPLAQPVARPNFGLYFEKMGALGQSICVLAKK